MKICIYKPKKKAYSKILWKNRRNSKYDDLEIAGEILSNQIIFILSEHNKFTAEVFIMTIDGQFGWVNVTDLEQVL